MRRLARRIVHSRMFEYLLVVLISGSAILQGVSFDTQPIWLLILLGLFLTLLLLVLVLEVLLKMIALSPRVDRYFRNGWNAFDFLTISFLITSIAGSVLGYWPTAAYGTLIILVRLLRLLRGLSTVQELNLILSTLFRSIPSMGHIAVLLGIILYMYALVGTVTFDEHDPANWGSLGISAWTLFKIVTLDGWSEIVRPVTEANPFAWAFFVSFVVISAYVVANLFIAIVIKNQEEARLEGSEPLEKSASKEEIIRELRSTQEALRRLEERLRQLPD